MRLPKRRAGLQQKGTTMIDLTAPPTDRALQIDADEYAALGQRLDALADVKPVTS